MAPHQPHRRPSLLVCLTSTDTTPEEGGGILGLSGSVHVEAGPVFPVESGWSRVVSLEPSVLLGGPFLSFGRGQAFLHLSAFLGCWLLQPQAGIYEAHRSATASFLGSQSLRSTSRSLPMFVFYFRSRGKDAHPTFTTAEAWLLSRFIRT